MILHDPGGGYATDTSKDAAHEYQTDNRLAIACRQPVDRKSSSGPTRSCPRPQLLLG